MIKFTATLSAFSLFLATFALADIGTKTVSDGGDAASTKTGGGEGTKTATGPADTGAPKPGGDTGPGTPPSPGGGGYTHPDPGGGPTPLAGSPTRVQQLSEKYNQFLHEIAEGEKLGYNIPASQRTAKLLADALAAEAAGRPLPPLVGENGRVVPLQKYNLDYADTGSIY